MKNIKRVYLFFFLVSASLFFSCSFNKEQDAASLVWGNGYIGSNGDLRYFPDKYANYWIYAFNVDTLGLSLKITGNYPAARFFNFVLNDESTTADIASIEDVNIKPNTGSVNPYVVAAADPTQNNYEVYILPESKRATMGAQYPNALYYPDTTKKLSMIMRIYLAEDQKQGKVALPHVTAFNAHTMTPVPLPPRLISGLDTLPEPTDQKYEYAPLSFFFRAPRGLGYPNRPAEYLFASNQLQTGKVFAVRFKPPREPDNVTDYPTADVRYWSVCLGDAKTYVASAIKDTDFKKDNDWVTVIVADPASANFTAIKEKIATSPEMNLLPYDTAKHGMQFLFLYRNMVINQSYANRMDQVTIIGFPVNPLTMFSNSVIGDYGPIGKMYTESVFLDNTFSVNDIRVLPTP